MKVFRRLVAALSIGLLCSAQMASAAIIVDTPVEVDTDWTAGNPPWFNASGTIGFGGAPFFPGAGGPNNGPTAAHTSSGSPVSGNFSNPDVSGGNNDLEIGIYTISFAMGDFLGTADNLTFLFDVHTVDFAGLTEADAIASSTLAPADGTWALWTYTWNVGAGNTNLGNDLSFSITGTGGALGVGNGALDGVGALSGDGSGFLVDFEPIPEPSSLVLGLVFGLAGVATRRRKR